MKLDTELIHRLIAAQFPQWAALPIRPVESGGWDNRTFRLGEELVVRLPSAERYAAQVHKEQRWLPVLGPLLPLAISEPVAMVAPGEGYPWHGSVYRWIEGEPATVETIGDLQAFATALGQFLASLQGIQTEGFGGEEHGCRAEPDLRIKNPPAPGEHNFFRGGGLSVYDGETRWAIANLRGEIDADAASALWESALGTTWTGRPVWIHGDVSAGNLLVKDGELCAVIDWGCCGVGDPACDLAIAWTLFERESREAFRAAVPLDAGTWMRGRAWALWKALITLEEHIGTNRANADAARRVIGQVLG